MTPDEWAKGVEKAAERWDSAAKEISVDQWRSAMVAKAGRLGSWHNMTRWQKTRARIRIRVRRVMRALS